MQMASYQQGAPTRIDELGFSHEEVLKRKQRRKYFFAGIAIAVVLVFGVLAYEVLDHQQQKEDLDYSRGFGTASLANVNDLTALSVASGCETTMLILRHCEKTGEEVSDADGNQHCSYIGYERAQFLKTLFGPGGWPIPSVLYALTPSRDKHLNFREFETLAPLANQYGIPINMDFEANEEVAVDFFSKVESGKMCGKIAVVSWKHEMIGALARLLGCPNCPFSYPEDSFDQVWQLKYVYDTLGTHVIRDNHNVIEQSPPSPPPPPVEPVGEPEGGERKLRKKKKNKKTMESDDRKWSVYFSIQAQNFDPLKFSASVGDYTSNANMGGTWFHAEDAPSFGDAGNTDGEM